MYKAVLVDDEPVVLRSMKEVIDWNQLGFQVCGCAANGEEACRLIQEMHPALVVTDVRMPKMDGIQLATYISKNYPEIQVIIISGYDEFDYAQSALRVGVVEYIMKPTKKTELEDALKKVARRIQKRKDLEQNIRQMQKTVRSNMLVLKNQFLNDLAGRLISSETDPIHKLEGYGGKLKGKSYFLCCFEQDYAEEESLPEMQELLWVQLHILMREYLQNKASLEKFVRDRFVYYIIEDDTTSILDGQVMEWLCEVTEEFKSLTGSSVSVGISRKYADYHRLYAARKDCEIALEERCYMGVGSCILYDEVKLFPGEGFEYDFELMNGIGIKIRSLNKTEAIRLIERMYEELKKNKVIFQQLYSQTVFILMELYNAVTEQEEAVKEQVLKCLLELSSYKTADMLKEKVLELTRIVMDKAADRSAGKNLKMIEAIKQYVEDHLRDEIALVDVADAVHLSKNYLCSLFKKETGETFFSYLTKARMEKAKMLLKKTDHKVYVIAEMTGYADYTYFSQVFKKYTGITAVEYREIYLEE